MPNTDRDSILPKGWRITAIRKVGDKKYTDIPEGTTPTDRALQNSNRIVIHGKDANGKDRFWTLNGGAENLDFIANIISDIKNGKWTSPK